MSAKHTYYRLDEFGKIRKIWGEGEVVSIPADLDDEAMKKLWEPNQRWTFDDIIFGNCTFDFTQTYVFIGCAFRNCDMSGISPSRAMLTQEIAGCINVRGSSCPPSGDFTGYKIAFDVWTGEPVLITLHVPKDAERRGNSFEKKFRVSCAQVVDIRFADGAKCQRAYSGHNPLFRYTPDCMVYPEIVFDQSYVSCASGIHMFLDPDDAIDYARVWRRRPHIDNVPRYMLIGRQRSYFGSSGTGATASVWDMMLNIKKEDGPCPYPERLEMDELGDWSWVNAERKDR